MCSMRDDVQLNSMTVMVSFLTVALAVAEQTAAYSASSSLRAHGHVLCPSMSHHDTEPPIC